MKALAYLAKAGVDIDSKIPSRKGKKSVAVMSAQEKARQRELWRKEKQRQRQSAKDEAKLAKLLAQQKATQEAVVTQPMGAVTLQVPPSALLGSLKCPHC